MIENVTEFRKFLNVLPQLSNNEVFFVSLSARNKYLTLQEREQYSLGRTEMFGREIIFDNSFESFNLVFKKLKTILEYRKTKNGNTIPDKCLTTYMNLNPSHTVNSVGNFIKTMTQELLEYTNNVVKGHDTKVNLDRFRNSRSILNTSFQKTSSRKMFVDIDIDCKNEEILKVSCDILTKNGAKFFVVKTQGGWHVVVKRETLKFNYVKYVIEHCNTLINNSEFLSGIVEHNKNLMVPVPGTLQANKLVKLVCVNY